MKKTFGYLFLESILIIVSVLAAFWLDNYRQHKADQKTVSILYEELKKDLKSDLSQWKKFETSNRIHVERGNKLIDILSSGDIKKSELGELLFRYEREMTYYRLYSFIDEGSTYSTIVNGQRLNIFANDTLFTRIQKYYSFKNDILGRLGMYEKYIFEKITPFMDEHFDRMSMKFNPDQRFDVLLLREPDFDVQRFQTRKFLNVIKNSDNFLLPDVYIRYYIKESTELIQEIEKRRIR